MGVHLHETEIKNVGTLSAKLTLSNKVGGRDTIVVDTADGALTAHVRVDAETVTGM